MRTLRRWLITVLLVVLALGVLAPFLSADRLRPYIQAALEAALNRKVQIGAVHLNLFTGPGFTVERVLIDDAPAAGVEPFAYVESMRARVRLTSLLAGKLAFSSLRLDAPSVNLVKLLPGPWNIQPLLDRSSSARSAQLEAVPDIQISGGRLNFKFGDTKSVFYISDADVDIYPNERGDLVIRFSGAPARTDRGSSSFGQISARGLLRAGPNGADQLTMGLHLERTAISELVRLFNARELGVHGFTTAEATLAGPLDKIEVTGSLNINDIHRWDLMPPHGEGWTLHYRGALDLRSHKLDLETIAPEGQTPPVSIKLAAADYLSAPKWSAGIVFHDLPAASLIETARHMGAPLAPGMQVDGNIAGEISYSNQSGLGGQLGWDNASVKFPRGGPAEFDSARLSFSNNAVVLDPVDVRLGESQSAEVEGEYALDGSHTAFKVTTPQLSIAQIEKGAGQVVETPPIPVLESLHQGSWKGWIAFDRKDDHPGIWSGDYELQNTVLEIPGLASPVRIASASVELKQDRIQMTRIRARAGTVRLEGDYRYDPEATRPHRLRLNIPELKLAELERLMLPTLRREEGFLARTFRLRNARVPKWLEERNVDASIQIGSLLNGDAPFGKLRTRLVWDGTKIVLSDLECRLDELRAAGTLTLSLATAAPSYQLTGSIENLDYKNGQLDIDGELETSGIGENLLLNLRSEGTFEGREITLAPETVVHGIAGTYRIAPASGIPRLLLSNLQVTQGLDTLVGQGSSQPDGRIVLELTSGRRQVRLTGMLLPIHPEPVAGR
ncbi:MAG TPA: AsmA family protein [Bryobacteraceae bacterium]|nr:AsmA family protein [Bryobacteraceae bacterium]